jgi:hypothetical protein
MKELLEIAGVAAVLLGHLAVLAVLVRFRPKKPRRPLVRLRPLMTPNEREFFARLRRALPDYEVLAQVSMGALLDVNVPEGYPTLWHLRRQFAMKIIDYVVCRRDSMQLVAIVELDDRTHDGKRQQDAARDALLASAGIPTLRWDSRRKPSQREIAERVRALVAAGG